MIRYESPAGASESENGCFVDQNPLREEPPEEELARLGAEPLEASPADAERDDPGRLVRDPGDPQIEADGVARAAAASRKKSTSPSVSAKRLRQ